MTDFLKVIILGIIEGITEWLPISSTGHMILADEFLRLDMSAAFMEMFLVVIQLGAILAVAALYWGELFPFSFSGGFGVKIDVFKTWVKIVVACVPAGVIGILFNDIIEAMFYNYQTVAFMLVLYGVLFIVVERINKNQKPKINSLAELSASAALFIGVFQLLSLIPGTSRSGATILGAIFIGTSRAIAARFSFLLAVPVMAGASLVKILKFGLSFTGKELLFLFTGMAVAFAVSVLAIRFLTSYVRRHDFTAFGWYRIALGAVVLLYFFFVR
jgi:undecaprenyl-diphosphatase